MGKTYINVDKKYEITSKNLIYDKKKNIIFLIMKQLLETIKEMF